MPRWQQAATLSSLRAVSVMHAWRPFLHNVASTRSLQLGVDLKKSPPFIQTPAELRAELAASLAALGTTYIDLLILNRPSPMLRIEDTMGE